VTKCLGLKTPHRLVKPMRRVRDSDTVLCDSYYSRCTRDLQCFHSILRLSFDITPPDDRGERAIASALMIATSAHALSPTKSGSWTYSGVMSHVQCCGIEDTVGIPSLARSASHSATKPRVS